MTEPIAPSPAPPPASPPAPPDAATQAGWKRRDALHHDREAGRYDSLIGREFAPYQQGWTAVPWAERLAASGARVVLDIGCGTGRTTLPVAAAGPAVIALDLSRGMLLQAVAKAKSLGIADVWPLIADAERLPLADDAVDGVVCQGVLHHLPDVRVALSEADRVLAAGGWLCLAEPDVEASGPYRTVRWIGRRAAAMLRRLRTGDALHSPGTDDERPLDPDALLAPLEALGYTVTPAYLVHLPVLYRLLPRRAARVMAGAINAGDRSRRRPADILVVVARRDPAPSPSDPGGVQPSGAVRVDEGR